MRAHEFPRVLFTKIHQAVGEPLLERWPNQPVEYFKMLNDKNEPFSHIGIRDSNYGSGPISTFSLWGWTMLENMTDEKNKLLDPLLEIRGGPSQAGVWSVGQGNLIKEDLIVTPGYNFRYYGLELTSPLLRLMGEIITFASELRKNVDMRPVSYWQAFRNPERDYTSPD